MSLTSVEELREVAGGIVGRLVVIHDLPEELNLLPPRRHGVAHIGQDVGLGAHALVPARVRHHAERAVVVAAFDDGDVRLEWIAAPRDSKRKRHVVPGIDIDFGGGGLRRVRDQDGQHLELLRSDDDVDDVAVRFAKQGLAFLLCDAAGDGDHRAMAGLFLEHAQLAEPRVELLLRALANAARVDDDHIGIGVF